MQASTVKSILSNEKYRGDALLQKTLTVDFLTKKAKVNEGEAPQYYVENSHPAIVSAEVFELAQAELAGRRHREKESPAPFDERTFAAMVDHIVAYPGGAKGAKKLTFRFRDGAEIPVDL